MSSAGIAVNRIGEDQVVSPSRIERSKSLPCLNDFIVIYLAVPGSSVIRCQFLTRIQSRPSSFESRVCKVRAKPIEKDFELSVDAPSIEERKTTDDLKIVAGRQPESRAWIEPVVANPKIKLSPLLEELINSTFAGLEKKRNPVMSSKAREEPTS
ncbi:hypothetical protein HPP92_021308 [Vanilla planifolia]|uniref:Uncharacterized protein n=1 Tax=Vanilla planifolia TaxID=51239 RepID=A0A835UIE7_VANPL|nr:hypothetical protein HPP92_021308 [Vanilla planifolia]